MRSILLAATVFAMACTPPDQDDALAALLEVPKFEKTILYAGVFDSDEKASLVEIVNHAIRDIMAMPQPRPAASVRGRLQRVIEEVDLYETEDRERAYRYVIEAWRAAGFDEESRLFSALDEKILSAP